jgi:hypothetical protein
MRAAARAFANGEQVPVNGNRVTFDTVSGENTLALLARHEGLDKMYNVTGSTGTGQYAGIWGRVTVNAGISAPSWRFPRWGSAGWRRRRGGKGAQLERLPRGGVERRR